MKILRFLIAAALALAGAAHAADVAISALPAASAVVGTEVIPIVQGGATRKVTPDAITNRAIAPTSLAAPALLPIDASVAQSNTFWRGDKTWAYQRTLQTADSTLYVRTAAAPVAFTSSSANITWTSHGLSVNDPVVFTVSPNPRVVTVTIASPAVFSLTAHGFSAGQPVRPDTTGALPTGLTKGTTYYVIAAGLTADDFEVSATPGGSAINTSGSQSGQHYASMVGAMPTFSTAGLLVEGQVYYVKTVVDSSHITISATSGGAAAGTATLATGSPTYSASTGNDGNDGSAQNRAHALLTPAKADQLASQGLDLQGQYHLTIKLASSTYLGGFTLHPVVGSGWFYDAAATFDRPTITLQGDVEIAPEYAANVKIRPQPGDGYAIRAAANWSIDGINPDTTSGDDGITGITTNAGTVVLLDSIWWQSKAADLSALFVGGTAFATYASTYSGGPTTWYFLGNSASAIELGQLAGAFVQNSIFVGMLNAPAYSTAFLDLNDGGTVVYQAQYHDGDALTTGVRALLASGAQLTTAGHVVSGYLPGDSGPTVSDDSMLNGGFTQSGIVPNTAPAAGGLLVGNAGATAYAPVAMSGDVTLAATGAATLTITSGTWTPVDASGASLTLTGATGTWMKIGKMYFITGEWVYPSNADGSTAIIGGLPAAAVATNFGLASTKAIAGTGTYPDAFVVASTATIKFSNAGGKDTLSTNLNVNTGSYRVAGFYLVP